MRRVDERVVVRWAGAPAVVLGAAFGVVLLLVVTRWGPLTAVDDAVVRGLHRFAVEHPVWVTAMKGVSFVGSAQWYCLVAAPVVAWACVRRQVATVVFVVGTIAGNWVLNPLVKGLVGRVRPVLDDPVAHVGGWSFPSGHAEGSLVAYGALTLVVAAAVPVRWRRWLVTAAAALVFAVGFSRVALGVHYPSDVLGGFLLGGALLATTATVLRRSPSGGGPGQA